MKKEGHQFILYTSNTPINSSKKTPAFYCFMFPLFTSLSVYTCRDQVKEYIGKSAKKPKAVPKYFLLGRKVKGHCTRPTNQLWCNMHSKHIAMEYKSGHVNLKKKFVKTGMNEVGSRRCYFFCIFHTECKLKFS